MKLVLSYNIRHKTLQKQLKFNKGYVVFEPVSGELIGVITADPDGVYEYPHPNFVLDYTYTGDATYEVTVNPKYLYKPIIAAVPGRNKPTLFIIQGREFRRYYVLRFGDAIEECQFLYNVGIRDLKAEGPIFNLDEKPETIDITDMVSRNVQLIYDSDLDRPGMFSILIQSSVAVGRRTLARIFKQVAPTIERRYGRLIDSIESFALYHDGLQYYIVYENGLQRTVARTFDEETGRSMLKTLSLI